MWGRRAPPARAPEAPSPLPPEWDMLSGLPCDRAAEGRALFLLWTTWALAARCGCLPGIPTQWTPRHRVFCELWIVEPQLQPLKLLERLPGGAKLLDGGFSRQKQLNITPPPPPCISYALVQATVDVGSVIFVYVILITHERYGHIRHGFVVRLTSKPNICRLRILHCLCQDGCEPEIFMFPRLSCVCMHLEMWAEVKVHSYHAHAHVCR